MRSLSRVASYAAVLSLLVVSTVSAQARRNTAAFNRNAAPAPVQAASGGGMNFTLLGGIATGEGGIDLGFAIAARLMWDLAGAPVDLRIDPYAAKHGGNCGIVDCDLTVIGASAAAQYNFTSGGSGFNAAPVQGGGNSAAMFYIMGGLGFFNSNFSADYAGFGGSASSTDLGIMFGGGYQFSEKMLVEARYMSIDYFSPIAFLFGWIF
jgi:hypothetical protein